MRLVAERRSVVVMQRMVRWVAMLGVGLALAGCAAKRMDSGDITGSIAPSQADLRGARETYAQAYQANPTDRNAAINYARALRASDQGPQAVAVLQPFMLNEKNDYILRGEFGRALADAGQHQQALDMLARATRPEMPDWRIYNVRGTVHDAMGQHQQAQEIYLEALKIAPDEAGILSNLGLSLALSNKLNHAETVLRKAYAMPKADQRVRQNLAIVIAMQGRFPEAEQIVKADLPPDQAAQNVAVLRQMMAQQNSWKQLKALDGRKPSPAIGGRES